MPPKKYTDFTVSDPFSKPAKHLPQNAGEMREYVSVTCPHCNVAFTELLLSSLATHKAGECLAHLRVCPSAAEAGVVVPPAKKRQVCDASTDGGNVLVQRNTQLVSTNAELTQQNVDLTAKVDSLQSEMATMRLSMQQLMDCNTRNESLLKACADALGIAHPPLPAPAVITQHIDTLKHGDSARCRELEKQHMHSMEELKQMHNEELLDMQDARTLDNAVLAVRREVCLFAHPDRASRFESTIDMGNAIMKRLGQLHKKKASNKQRA